MRVRERERERLIAFFEQLNGYELPRLCGQLAGEDAGVDTAEKLGTRVGPYSLFFGFRFPYNPL